MFVDQVWDILEKVSARSLYVMLFKIWHHIKMLHTPLICRFKWPLNLCAEICWFFIWKSLYGWVISKTLKALLYQIWNFATQTVLETFYSTFKHLCPFALLMTISKDFRNVALSHSFLRPHLETTKKTLNVKKFNFFHMWAVSDSTKRSWDESIPDLLEQ